VPRKLYWVIGALVALLGVFIARGLAPQLPERYAFYGTIVGVTVAVVGVFLAARGAGRERPPTDTD
jgi:hypothetical protein